MADELNKACVKKKAVPLLFRSQGVCLMKGTPFTPLSLSFLSLLTPLPLSFALFSTFFISF
jgi:hypothetical protein